MADSQAVGVSKLEILTIASGMIGVVAANSLVYDHLGSGLVLGISACWVAMVVVLFLAARVRGRQGFPQMLQAFFMCGALFLPIFGVAVGHGGNRMHLMLLESLRNLSAVSAIFAFDPLRRRGVFFVGTLISLFSFTLEANLVVTCCVFLQLVVSGWWLSANDEERWKLSESPIRWNFDFISVSFAAILVAFAVAVAVYPADPRGDSLLSQFSSVEEVKTRKQIMSDLQFQQEALETASAEKYGEEADQNGAEGQGSGSEGDDENKQGTFSTRRKTKDKNDAIKKKKIRNLFDVEGKQVRHVPTANFDKFDGERWHSPPVSLAPNVSAQISDQEAILKMVNRHDLDLRKLEGDVDFQSGQFLEQVRAMASESMTGAPGKGTLIPKISQIPPDDLQAMLSSAPNWSSDASMVYNHYDIQALADDMQKDPALLWEVLSKAGGDGEYNQNLLSTLKRWRAARGGPALPPELAKLLEEWTQGTEPGWEQVMAVVNGLRNHCEHDPTVAVPAEETDSVKYFLTKSRRGPDYQFASSAVVLLRSLGYPTRLVGGYYAKEENRSWMTGRTTVKEDDVHYWAQVMMADQIWVDIEPTPGYEIPSLKDDPPLYAFWNTSVEFVKNYGQQVAITVIALGLSGFLLRRLLKDMWFYIRWRFAFMAADQTLVNRTRDLIRHRLRRAGVTAPESSSMQTLAVAFGSLPLNQFSELAQQTVYRVDPSKDPDFRRKLRDSSVVAVQTLTRSNMRKFQAP